MARRRPLEDVLRLTRLEARRAANPSMNEAEKAKLVHLVNRVQDTLYMGHFWSFLQKRTPVVLYPGQRFYDIPSGYNLDRIETIYYKDDTNYLPLHRGISLDCYNTYDSFTDERSDPPERWDIVDNEGAEQLEIWPIPQTSGYQLFIQGLRTITPLVNDTDIVELDDFMIALYCASELLMDVDKEEAMAKLSRANQRRDLLIATSEVAADPIVISGGSRDDMRRPIDIRYAPRR